MRKAELYLNNNVLSIKIGKTSFLVRGILLFFAVFSFLIPIIAVVFVVISHSDFKFGHVLLFIMLWLPAYFLLRIILWNSYGKEVLVFSKGKVTYVADYKFFLDSKQELIGDISVEIIKNNNSKKDENTFLFKSENNQIETVISLSLEKCQSVIDEINSILTEELVNNTKD